MFALAMISGSAGEKLVLQMVGFLSMSHYFPLLCVDSMVYGLEYL